MAWFAAALPYISTAVGVAGAYQQGQAARRNADFLQQQARMSESAAARDEEAQRRASAIALGRQRAAIGEAGGGYGGSAGLLADQSAVLAELDALNIRYGGQLQGSGLMARAAGYSSRASSTGLLAGTALLMGASKIYTNSRLSSDGDTPRPAYQGNRRSRALGTAAADYSGNGLLPYA